MTYINKTAQDVYSRSTPKLDKKDLKLVYELELDARQSITSLAKKIGTSKEVANYRFKRLQDNRLIKKFKAIINYRALGYQEYRLLINLYNLKENTREEIAEYLSTLSNVMYRLFLQSNWDLEVIIWVKQPEDFYHFYDAFILKYAEYINNKEFSVITKAYKFTRAYLHGKHDMIRSKPKHRVILDETDQKILDELIKNPRIDYVTLSKKLHMPASTAAYRMKNLIKAEVLLQISARVDTAKLGFTGYKIRIQLSDQTKKKSVIQYLSMQPNVVNILKCIGESDLETNVEFKSHVGLNEFLNKLRTSVPYISDFEVIILL